MAAVPVGYEAFQSLRRKSVTLLCFLLTSTMAMGIAVYVDSYSVHYWVQAVDVGDVSTVIQGPEVEDILSNVRQIDGVSEAVLLESSAALINYEYAGAEIWDYFDVCAPSQEYFDTFPDVFTLARGRLPQNESEIAISQTVDRREWVNITLGSYVTYAYTDETHKQNVTIVGVYTTMGSDREDSWRYDRLFGYDIIAFASILAPLDEKSNIHADVDRSRITPFNAGGSLAFVDGISNTIRALDPFFTPEYQYSRYHVTSLLESGILSYMGWLAGARLNQLWRAAPAMLLVLMVSFLAIRYNVNERRYEANMLIARGASEGNVNNIIYREIGIIAVVSCIAGLLLGVLVSRVAMTATGYFQFDFSLMIAEPWLVTQDSLILALVVGILLPVLTLVVYHMVYSTKKTVETSTGRLHKISRGLTLIRWDMLVVILTGVLMIALYSGGSEIRANPFFGVLAVVTPLPLFLGFASLAVKSVRRGANHVSRGLTSVVGEVPSFVGVRRIGKEASSAGPAIMVLVLSISLAWSSAVTDSTLPATHLNQSRFALGADVTFQLEANAADQLDDFLENATQHSLTSSVSLVDVVTLFLADDWESRTDFVVVDPLEYISIGYDHLGLRLDESELGEYLIDLENDPSGVIITKDIADSYAVEEGDVLRGFEELESIEVYEFTIIGIVPAIPELLERASHFGGVSPFYYDYSSEGFGERRAWVHRDFARVLFNTTTVADHYCVLGTVHEANGTAVAEDLLNSGGDQVVASGEWGAVDFEMTYYLSQVSYHIDRAVDTMMTTVTMLVILGAFTIYAAEGIRARRREIALLRSMGASNSLVVKAQGIELLVLMCLSVLLLALYSPLFLANSLLTAVGAYGSWPSLFPVVVFPVIPWLLLLLVFTFFVVSVVVFIAAIAVLGSRVHLAMALNAAWAESGPYGGDF